MLVLIAAIFTAISVSFFCSLLEACLLSLSNADLAAIDDKKPAVAQIWKHFKENIQKPIAVILIINTLSYTIGAAIAGSQFTSLFGKKWIALFSLGLSLALFQWTEILPKTLGVRYRRGIATLTGLPLRFMVRLFGPFVTLTEWLNKPFEDRKAKTSEGAAHEISLLARFAVLTDQITREQESIIARSVDMSALRVCDIMVERENMNVLSTQMTLQEGLLAAHIHRHTRYPLTQAGDLDRIVGYVNFKDIVGALRLSLANPTLAGVSRPIAFVHSQARIPELLKKLTHGYQHMAVVQDDGGRTMGLVTLENVVEVIVGQLEDEYDTPPDYIIQLSEHRFRIGGSVMLSQLRRQFGDPIPDAQRTIGDWLVVNGRPVKDREAGPFAFHVRKITRGKIHDVILERRESSRKSGVV